MPIHSSTTSIAMSYSTPTCPATSQISSREAASPHVADHLVHHVHRVPALALPHELPEVAEVLLATALVLVGLDHAPRRTRGRRRRNQRAGGSCRRCCRSPACRPKRRRSRRAGSICGSCCRSPACRTRRRRSRGAGSICRRCCRTPARRALALARVPVQERLHPLHPRGLHREQVQVRPDVHHLPAELHRVQRRRGRSHAACTPTHCRINEGDPLAARGLAEERLQAPKRPRPLSSPSRRAGAPQARRSQKTATERAEARGRRCHPGPRGRAGPPAASAHHSDLGSKIKGGSGGSLSRPLLPVHPCSSRLRVCACDCMCVTRKRARACVYVCMHAMRACVPLRLCRCASVCVCVSACV